MDAESTVKLLTQAQEANESRYPTGRMRFSIGTHSKSEGRPRSENHQIIEGEVQWSGTQSRTVLTRWGPSNQEINIADSSIESRKEIYLVNSTVSATTSVRSSGVA